MFCPHCKSILRPRDKGGKRVLWCSCGYTSDAKVTTEIKEKGETAKIIEVVENIDTRPMIEALCPECSNKKAYYWTQQTRAADEPETRFFKCTKCDHTWREYA